MAKKFNITGTCIPERHYMADIAGKMERIEKMVAQGDYFTINRPRQYGKTTVMYLLRQRLMKNRGYLVLNVSFESIDTPTYENHQKFIFAVLDVLGQRLELAGETEAAALIKKNNHLTDFNSLSTLFRELVEVSGRKTVLMIDEVDKAANNQLFLDFLGMLRAKYLAANEGQDHTFHSVILAGVHDIKSMKTKIRDDNKKMYNSPWNIAVDFKVELELERGEIACMLTDYSTERQVKMDVPYFADKLFYYTSGYPFLVSYLCKIIDEEILPGRGATEWKPGDLTEAVQIALTESNTNFESLVKNLENNGELYELVFNLIMNGREFSYNPDHPVIGFGVLYGLLKKRESKAKIHNRLYEQRIYNYMASKMELSGDMSVSPAGSFIEKGGTLNIKKVIEKFQEFMIQQYSKKDGDFIERNGRLLFLAFIKPIINGKGFDFKEVQVSEEKRLDVVITYGNQKNIVELKIWRGESHHREGVEQLADYLERQHEAVGYLLIYDLRKEKGRAGKWEKIETKGKNIFAAWV